MKVSLDLWTRPSSINPAAPNRYTVAASTSHSAHTCQPSDYDSSHLEAIANTMVHFYDSISPDLQEWIMKQPCFFTASAPLHGRHINLSPKGLPSTSFSILNPNLVGYVDATGSGIETVSHIQENGRCTIMFCSFDASPRIMRLFCTGRVIPWDHPEFDSWRERMGNKHFEGMRAVILLDVWKVGLVVALCTPPLTLRIGSDVLWLCSAISGPQTRP